MNANIQGKVWGITQELFFKNNVEMHRIEVKKGGFCSKHKHEHKYNSFFVESGKLKIKIWKNAYNLIDETILTPQCMCIVSPNEYHLFECLEDTVAFEIYWVELDRKDIDRENIGGINETDSDI